MTPEVCVCVGAVEVIGREHDAFCVDSTSVGP